MPQSPQRAPGRRSRSGLRVFLVSWALLSAMASVWAVATPLGGSPDEAAHVVKAASVARGQLTGTASASGTVVHVPEFVAYVDDQQTCYAFHPNVTAACSLRPVPGDPARTVHKATTAGLYNPLYYAMVGWPSAVVASQTSIYLMRIVSAVLSSLFLALAFTMLAGWRRRLVPLLGFAVAATPMVFFLDSAVNPNSLEVTATLAAFVGVLSIVLRPDPALLARRSALVAVSAVVAANTRGLSPLWVAIALFAPLLLAGWPTVSRLLRERAIQVAIGVILVGTALAVAWTLLSGSLGAPVAQPGHAIAGSRVGDSPVIGFVQVFVGTFDYGQGIVGVFGWLDTPAPSAVFFIWSGFIGALVMFSLVLLRGRAFRFALGLILALLFIPPLLQAAYIRGGGIIWQGRYTLPLFVCVMTGAAVLLADRLPELGRRSRVLLVSATAAAWFLGQVLSFVYTLKRYAIGAGSGSWKELLLGPEWAPPGGVPLSVVLGVVVFGVGAALFLRLALATTDEGSAAAGQSPADLGQDDDDSARAQVVEHQRDIVPEPGSLAAPGA